MVNVFAEVWRVLRDDGVCWLNLGDSYAGSGKGPSNDSPLDRPYRGMSNVASAPNRWLSIPQGIKAKDLCGIPWRVAFALQAAGWYLRSDIIWAKPNPMPESVTDRPTKAHEYLFLLTKSPRYFYNAEAIAEPASIAMQEQMERGYDGLGLKDYEGAGVQNPSDVKSRIIANARNRWQERKEAGEGPRRGFSQNAPPGAMSDVGIGVTRNKRSVWQIPTQSFEGAHFATFPEALVEPCILAGSKEGDLVLDPFCGSGTTGAVAIRLQRNFVGIELNPAYIELARKRIGAVAPLLAKEIA